ncbi:MULTISPECIES: PAS domain-containing protein [Coprobacillaceae]|uniref:PAS domain-containing protein n=1 Tax=Coprobacillaceae TaxID=2810280 RepID=UPI000E4E72C0|nr:MULTISPECIES: PAS domain-containing protein [Coprobacillaceae]RHM60247.1 fatty acid/phospholipid synthesis protein PlsX [Coprobacillus sp. AF33-1AC]RHS93798.1 fatty acid/phospholipid synthesis protein PlsX [Erysipelatoclostridium sp. AM42-17]
MKLDMFFKSVIDQELVPVVLCDTHHTIIYMNPVAINRYQKFGGESLIGQSLLNCHGEKSKIAIGKILTWFKESEDHNRVYTSYNSKEDKDIYMIALRDENKQVIGYYEKHECRKNETGKMYDMD